VEAVDDFVSTSSFNQDWSSLGDLDCPVVIDPRHILKRFRDRRFNCVVKNGFNAEAPIANVFRDWQELGFASAVFSRRSLSKMHDDLSLQLFSLRSLFVSHERGDRATLASYLVSILLAMTFQQPFPSKRDREYRFDVNPHSLTIDRRFTQKDHFVSGRILKEKKAMGDNNAGLFTGAFGYSTLSVVIAARIALAKNDPGIFISTESGHIHLDKFWGITG
jgi:hypothetical protein